MPCFKGLAVSIHTPDGPISEHSVQKQSRASRISSYIPVPAARIPPNSLTNKPEQSTFAISITLLTPGLNVPYSTPKPSADDPYPRPRVVGGLPGYMGGSRGRDGGPTIPPYIPRTTNPNETVAAYIYFDGRVKEEVATLLRRGEETWVNSRWVSVPESEGGGLAEREFLFREVGLERWLNGLDLEGGSKDKAERIERRQRRLEKKRRKKVEAREALSSDDEADAGSDRVRKMRAERNGVLRYGSADSGSPVEDIANDDDGLFSSDSDSSDSPPQAEAAGQIKVALFRVLASGEIKRGEYSPQFDAHDDDGDPNSNGNDGTDGHNGGGDEEIDHTTSFAKPKTLDPKSISTQTVTGLDPPEAPYAVFTFFYRGQKQLQKMGIIETASDPQQTPLTSKRKASGPDFSKLEPLKAGGTVGFSGYREAKSVRRRKDKSAKNGNGDAMDSDADDDEADDDDERAPKYEDAMNDDDTQAKDEFLSPEDAKRTGELTDGVQKIKLKRQHSQEPLTDAQARKSPHLKTEDSPTNTNGTPRSIHSTTAEAGTPPSDSGSSNNVGPLSTTALEHLQQREGDGVVGSPFKRHRASLPNGGIDTAMFAPLGADAVPNLPPPTAATAESATFGVPPRPAMGFGPTLQQAEAKLETADVKKEEETQAKPQVMLDDEDEEL